VPRDRRWDFLYERQKQPVKTFVLDRFADELADALRPEAEADGPALRLALELAALDLARDWDGLEARLEAAALPPVRRDRARALGRELVERCLELKERATGARLGRPELAEALRLLEARVFRVTLR
jgi:hypothetical protein